jgi:hypothetical protein
MLLVVAVSVLEFAYRPARSPYGSAILESRPVGYWDLGELRVGPEARNALAGKPAGRYSGAIGFGTHGAIASSTDTAIQLDYRGGAITFGAPEAGPSSLAFWLRPDAGTALAALYAAWRPPPEGTSALLPWTVASQTTAAFTWTMAFEVPDRLSVIYQERSGNHAVRVSGRVENGRFNFVVLILEPEGPRLWIDGRPAATRARRIPPSPLGRPAPLTFGGPPGVGLKNFAGTVDDVAVFARGLRGREIRRLWRVARSE